MNGIMSVLRNCYQIIRIENARISISDLIHSDWIQVMDVKTFMDFIPRNAKITSVITSDYLVTDLSPFSGRVEILVNPSVETKSRFSNIPPERKIIEPFSERINST